MTILELLFCCLIDHSTFKKMRERKEIDITLLFMQLIHKNINSISLILD